MSLDSHGSYDLAAPGSGANRSPLREFLVDLQEAARLASEIDPGLFDKRMVLAFRIYAMVMSLTQLVRGLVPEAGGASRRDLAEALNRSDRLSPGESSLVATWLLRHHSVSLFVQEGTCVRWSRDLRESQHGLASAVQRLAALAPTEPDR